MCKIGQVFGQLANLASFKLANFFVDFWLKMGKNGRFWAFFGTFCGVFWHFFKNWPIGQALS